MQADAISLQQAKDFLAKHTRGRAESIELIGAGAWSQCFGFRMGEQDLAIRFGRHLDDFQKDQRVSVYSSAALPIPIVSEIGSAFDGYYAIATRVYGMPLETVDAAQWRALVPSLADAMEAIRLVDISATHGYGGWDESGNAPQQAWGEHLLLTTIDTPDRRTYGWRSKLATNKLGDSTFDWGLALLKQWADVPVPRCLTHCDLINRNVLVEQDKITGVFDWGCSRYGDHLYELAWFEFWSPWYPDLDMGLLRAALAQRWREVDYIPAHQDERLMISYLHIGLDHLGYNAYTGDIKSLEATAYRMRELVPHE